MRKIDHFERTLTNLHLVEAVQPPFDVIQLAGIVGLFTLCFEQSWKAMKEELTDQGYDESRIGLPRTIIKLAYAAGLIDAEQDWLSALEDRNSASHAYNEGIALRITENIRTRYLPMFDALLAKLR